MNPNEDVLTELEQITKKIIASLYDGRGALGASFVAQQCSLVRQLKLEELSTVQTERLRQVAIEVVEQQKLFKNAHKITDHVLRLCINSQHYSQLG
ncbi:hypothetical protein D2Q93_11490 [Alicyclobacillaceae bacterium I2511]|nr:hypothetical protein D2Q93_11490 [Alicyclobacillaceae bacterium I2511]